MTRLAKSGGVGPRDHKDSKALLSVYFHFLWIGACAAMNRFRLCTIRVNAIFRAEQNSKYSLAAAGVFAHGEPVIALKLNLAMDGGTRRGHFIHTPDTQQSSAPGLLQQQRLW